MESEEFKSLHSIFTFSYEDVGHHTLPQFLLLQNMHDKCIFIS